MPKIINEQDEFTRCDLLIESYAARLSKPFSRKYYHISINKFISIHLGS